MPVICPTTEAEYFCAKGWMTQISLRLFTKFDFWRSGFEALQPARRRSARQQSLGKAEGEAVERQVIDRAVILGGKRLAQMIEGVADRGLVHALDQQQRGEGAVVGSHALLAGLD